MRTSLRVVAGILVLANFAAADPIKRLTQPSISPDGSRIAFSWQGDIWVVGREGGRAERLTVHPAVDANPHWTPDGSHIVFSSNRYGIANVFSIDVKGNDLKRLTYEGAPTVPNAVSPDGKWVYGQSASFTASRTNVFRVPITGGDITQLTEHPFEGSFYPVLSPDGKKVYYDRGGYGPAAWQKPGVKSSAMPNLFVADTGAPLRHNKPLDRSEATQMFPSVAGDGRITYVSNESGWPNIWRMNPDGSGKRRLTDHRDGTVRFCSVSKDGRFVAYDFESELWVLDIDSGKSTKLAVDVPADARTTPVQEITLASGVEDYTVAPDGKRAVLAMRGDLFLIPEKGGTTRRLTTNPAWDGQPSFLDGKRVIYVASSHGHRSLATVDTEGHVKPFLADSADLTHPVVSPDGKSVAYVRGGEEILVIPSAGGTPKSILKGAFRDSITDALPFSWSADSKWLLIDRPTSLGSSEVTACEIGSDKRIVVARTAHGASTPRFLPNGKGVYFIATEYDFKPDLFIVDLVPQEVTFAEDDLDKLDEKPAKKEGGPIEIQEAGIELRMRRLTRSEDVQDAVAAADGRAIFVSTTSGGLLSLTLSTGVAKPVEGAPASSGGLQLGNGKLYLLSGGKMFALGLERPGLAPIPFSAVYNVDMRDEERALFEEVWWAMGALYYDERMHGKDWNAIKSKFEQIVPYCYDRADFYALMGEMMEELDSSHLGSTAPPMAPPGNDAAGYLGIQLDPGPLESRGIYVVKSIDLNSPADHPASRLKIGDRILSVDGVEPDPRAPIASLLNTKAGKKVLLRIERAGSPKEILIKPGSIATQRELNYQNWVTWERQETERLSKGRLTYVHIRAMDDPSYEQFLREIRTYTPGKKGLIIDVRYNGGGSTSHKVLGVLIKSPWLIRTTRGYQGLRLSENIYRGDSLELPTALLMNTYSFSNAEIMGEGFRQLKRGPIIGERTPGYVIGTGAHGLWDGGAIRMPEIGSFSVNGEDMENNGRRPDFNVWFDPDAWLAGRDVQLEKAVEEMLK